MEQVRLHVDVVVVGGGIAGLRAALAARSAGAEVLLLAKGIPGRSGNTVVASGGIAGVLPDLPGDDTPERYAADILTAGHHLGSPELIRILSEEAGLRIAELQGFGVELQRVGGLLDSIKAPGHSRSRTYRPEPPVVGHKGVALAIPLLEAAEQVGVKLKGNCPVVAVHTDRERVVGVAALEMATGSIVDVLAPAVVIATGGAAYLYSRTNGTNDACGDGIALGMRSGARARDMEFVQYHPTRIDHPLSLFLTGALFPDGAVLRNRSWHAFMSDYHPAGNNAPRDYMSRGIFSEVQAGRGIDGGIYLDCSAIPAEKIALRHRKLQKVLVSHGVEFPAEPVVVSPAVHFLMGGLAISENGNTDVLGLYACGEASGGVHGANRLGSVAFADGLVFGARSGRAAAEFALQAGRPNVDVYHPAGARIRASAGPAQEVVRRIWGELRKAMWLHAGLVREESGLRSLNQALAEWTQEVQSLDAPDVSGAARLMELELALDTSRAICIASLGRTESRGAHWRRDFPDTLDAWKGSQSLRLVRSGQVLVTFDAITGTVPTTTC